MSHPLLAHITLLEKLFLNRSNLIKINEQLKEESSRFEERLQAVSEALDRTKESMRMLLAKQRNALDSEFKEARKKAEEIMAELSSLKDVDLLHNPSFCSKLQELQGLDKRIEEIYLVLKDPGLIDTHQTSAFVSSSILVQQSLIAMQMRVQTLQEEYGYLKVQREIVKVQQNDVEKQMDGNKFEIDKELIRRKRLLSLRGKPEV
jgi:FtsZ-binding cell division protein ZapB